jgi:hypothetical protein
VAGSTATSSGAANAGAGAAGSTSAGAAGSTTAGAGAAAPGDDSDAGTEPEAPGSANEVTIIAETSIAPATLLVDGASCAAGRCSATVPADGKLEVALTLEHTGSGKMPVLASWKGCGTPTFTFFPVTPGGTDYILNYETEFSGLQAGSICTAEIVEGGWLVFAGNMSLEIVQGDPYCAALQVSPMGVNASCFPPPGTTVGIKSDLPRWDCALIDQDGSVKDMMFSQAEISLTSTANQLVSCTGVAQ